MKNRKEKVIKAAKMFGLTDFWWGDFEDDLMTLHPDYPQFLPCTHMEHSIELAIIIRIFDREDFKSEIGKVKTPLGFGNLVVEIAAKIYDERETEKGAGE